jgi:hypothetical protein
LEPCWAGINDASQLQGLLALAALFNEYVYVNDSQVGDNPHLAASYRTKGHKRHEFFDLFLDLVQENIVRVAIRDATRISAAAQDIPCETLSDVLDSWVLRGKEAARVSGPITQQTREMMHTIDGRLTAKNIRRYDYVNVKGRFMLRVRETILGSTCLPSELDLGRLPYSVRRAYEVITEREYFSHSDIFNLLSAAGVPLSDPLVQIHGLFDECAYAEWHSANLTGCDSYSLSLNTARNEYSLDPRKATEEMLATAIRRFPPIGLDVFTTLTMDEILKLRSTADDLFSTENFLESSLTRGISIDHIASNYIERGFHHIERWADDVL